jgi:hypothetical protein
LHHENQQSRRVRNDVHAKVIQRGLLAATGNFVAELNLRQDDCPKVRHGFLEALKKALNNDILAHRWFTLCFLAAFEPNEQFKEAMVRWLKNLAERYRIPHSRCSVTSRWKQSFGHGKDLPTITTSAIPSHGFLD